MHVKEEEAARESVIGRLTSYKISNNRAGVHLPLADNDVCLEINCEKPGQKRPETGVSGQEVANVRLTQKTDCLFGHKIILL